MVRDIYDMKEYVRKELEGIEDYGTLHDMFCTVLHHHSIPYIAVRRARLREDALQMKMFRPGARPRSAQTVDGKKASKR